MPGAREDQWPEEEKDAPNPEPADAEWPDGEPSDPAEHKDLD